MPRPDGLTAAGRGLNELAIAADEEAWLARTRVFLTPIAAPSIMGLFGFLIGTVMLVTRPISYPAGMPGVRVGQ